MQRLTLKRFSTQTLFRQYLDKLRPNVKEISCTELEQLIEKDPIRGPPPTLHILDVRETYEWNESRIPFSKYSGRGTLERDIEQIVPDRYDDIVLYCAGGVRSILAADALTKMGYTNVKSLKGGIGEWKRDRPVLENHPTFKQ